MVKTHYGDPCIHCGVGHDAVSTRPCTGVGKPIPIAYVKVHTTWDGVNHFRVRFSDGHIEDRHSHASFHAPYYHFGHSDELIQPPRYDPSILEAAT